MVVNDMLLSARKLTSTISRHLRGLTLSERKRVEGFTLIELLVVIGILGVLAAAALVAINPAEAQKKARDTQRLKDMATIQSIVEQFLTDNPGAITTSGTTGTNTSATDANNCSTGWLSDAMGAGVAVGANLCKYANVIPIDPSNRATATTTSTGVDNATTKNAYYTIVWTSASVPTYKICTRLESRANAVKLINDGETSTNTWAASVFAVFTADISCPGTDI